MYASSSRVTPVQRMRNGGRRQSSTRGISPSPKRRSLNVGARTPKMTGDYQVLKIKMEQERSAVQRGRVSLATSLDQLGEHHVRQQEYDDAMDAFTEALREKRSAFCTLSSPSSCDNRSTISSSLISGEGGESTISNQSEHDRAIDEIVNTLRNIGNVHSLRGEQDEAMRYYTEVTNLRAQKSSNVSCDPSLSGGENKSMLSGLNDDNSTLMSEINEDVKALDDLFRSISFRNQGNNNAEVSVAGKEKRKSKQPVSASPTSPSNKRRKSSMQSEQNTIVENEPFKRSSSSLGSAHIPTSGSEVSEAMDMYRSELNSYSGEHLNQHKDMLNSLSLRAELLNENRKKPMDHKMYEQSGQKSMSKAADLELALEIYHQILITYEETKQVMSKQSQSNTTHPEPEKDEKLASNIASTLICMGSIYYKLGNRVEELRMYKEAKAVYRRAFGENHTFVAGARKNIGMVLAERGEYEDSMKQFDKAMRIYLSVNNGSEMNRDVASAISCMGNVKNRVGELDAALSQYMDALRIYKHIYEGTSDNEADALRDVTSTLKVIGMVHAKKGDLDTAMGFFQEAMILLRSPGIDHTSVGRETIASVLTRVAIIYLKKGDLDQAMAHYKEAYDLTVRNRGTTNHQEVAGILHYIGGIYHKRADYDDAMACYQEAIRIYHATLGPGNPTVAGTLVMVGSIYYKRRNLDSAMMFYREALRLNRDAYGMHHPDVAPILKSIGTILTKKGDYKEAYDIFRDVLSIKCTVHGTDHPEVASAYKSLGNVHYKLGDLADAERQYRHALSIYRKTKGEEHADTVAAKTTIEHLRYWMREREQRQLEQRHAKSTDRGRGESDERSC